VRRFTYKVLCKPFIVYRQCTKVYRSRYTTKIEINAVENEKSGSFLLKTMEDGILSSLIKYLLFFKDYTTMISIPEQE
jgi:hypothetical protein